MVEPIPWEAQCRATASALGMSVERIEVGAHNVVLFDTEVILRFPIRYRDADRIGKLGDRHRRAAALGLRAPQVLGEATGEPGTAHLAIRRVHGLPLTEALTCLGGSQRTRALAEVAGLLGQLRRVEPADWPFPGEEWVALWEGLSPRLDRLADRLPRARIRDWYAVARRAAEVAADAPLGLMHGDLQNPNVRIDRRGNVSGVLDWDTALIGDPAMDTAAVLHSVGSEATARLLASLPWLRDDMQRFAVYRSTWELQNALWRAGDDHWLFSGSPAAGRVDAPTSATS